MMDMNRTQEMVDTIHGSIAYSGIEGAVIGTPIFNRLHRILQNSLVYLTYPSNKVKRFEHSVGTMHLAGLFFFHSVCNSTPDVLEQFFCEVNAELISWNVNPDSAQVGFIARSVRQEFGDERILSIPYPKCRLYFQNTPANLSSENRLAYYIVYQSIRLAGLLHDVGHLPYSHVLEHSLQTLYQRILCIPERKRNKAHCHFLNVMKEYCGSSDAEFAIHEKLGQQFVGKVFECITECLPKNETKEFYFLAAVLYFTQAILSAKEGVNSLFSDLHRVVAGTLDCDRMDYCCRDEYCAGVSKELPDYNRIFSTVSLIYRKVPSGIAYKEAEGDDRARCYFAPSTKALRQIENLLRRRWDIYATINYHHRVHKHELLLEEVLAELGFQEMEGGEKPAKLTNVLPLRVSSIWQLVDQMNSAVPVEYTALQLDDSWLDTLLKQKYFETYGDSYLSFSKNGGDIMWHRLDELISVQKHYRSLFKRPGGFRQFDELFCNTLLKLVEGSSNSKLEERYTVSVSMRGEYIFNAFLREFASGKEKRGYFFSLFNRQVQLQVRKDNPYHIVDCFLADSSFSKGISSTDQLYITSPEQKEKPFIHYSALDNVLTSEQKLLPSFHAYYLPEYDINHSEYYDADTQGFLKTVAAAAVVAFLQIIRESKSTKVAGIAK